MRRISVILLLACSLRAEAAEAKEPRATAAPGGGARTAALPRVVVDHFAGDGASRKRVRSEVTRVLEGEETIDLVSVELLDAHRKHDASVDGSAEGWAEVAAKLDVVALIRGRVTKSRDSHALSLVVLSGHDGRRVGRVEIEATSSNELRERIKSDLWREVGPLIVQAGPTPKAAESEEPDRPGSAQESEDLPELDLNPYVTSAARPPPSEPIAPPEPPARARRCSWLEIMPGAGVLTRSFDYETERSGALRAYTLRRSPAAALEVTWYPGALSSCALASGIGLRLGYEQVLGVTSHVADRDLATSGLAARAELAFRIPIGPASVEPAAGYYRRRFVVEGDYVPDIDYQALGGGLKLGVRLDVFLFEARGSARHVLGSGQLQENAWFPGSSGMGFDASALLGVAPTPWLDLFVSGNLERYAFDLNETEPTDGSVPPARANGVADRAHDHFTSFMLGVRFLLSRHASDR